MHLQNFNYNGTVIQRRDDGFVNLTQMCQANGKRLDNWIRLKSTKSYLETLSNSLTSEVVKSEEGANGGTWGHPSVAINLARWISDGFAVWCDAHIFNLMTSGSTSLEIDPIEEMKLKIELAKLERDKANLENRTIELRHYVATALPKPIGDRILGVTEVSSVEYRDRIIHDEQVIRDGSTLNKTQLCKRYGYLTRTGKPDYPRLNKALNKVNIPSDAWKLTATIRENEELNLEYLQELDRQMIQIDRQLYLGEY